jgi:hypothetical protein
MRGKQEFNKNLYALYPITLTGLLSYDKTIGLRWRGDGIALGYYSINGNGQNNGNGDNSGPSLGERLGLIAAIITTIGDALAVAAARISIEEGIVEANSDTKEKREQEQLLTKMQNQIDSLQKELTILKKNQS